MPREGIPLKKDNIKKGHFKLSVEGIYKGITRAKKEGNSIEGTGGQKRGQTRNCNLPQILSLRKWSGLLLSEAIVRGENI